MQLKVLDCWSGNGIGFDVFPDKYLSHGELVVLIMYGRHI